MTIPGSSVLSSAYKASSPKKGVWSPGQSANSSTDPKDQSSNSQTSGQKSGNESDKNQSAGPPPVPIWTPSGSPSLERKEFRPVRLDTGSLKKQSQTSSEKKSVPPGLPPFSWDNPNGNTPSSSALTTPASEHSTLTTSSNYPGLSWDRRSSNYSSGTVTPAPSLTPTSHLPKAPNPTVTLLQKAREGQLPKGAAYLEVKQEPKTSLPQQRNPVEPLYTIKREYESEDESKRKIVELTAQKYPGIGPTSQEGIPIALRSGVREENQHQWYRRMYDSLHRAGKPARAPASHGYASEPEQFNYDSDAGYPGRYATLDRRRQRNRDSESNGSFSKTHDQAVYHIQPGRIEDYEPGRSSLAEKQTKQVQKQIKVPEKSFTSFALKESGYESDSQLVFRRRPESETASGSVDPNEQRSWYRDIQRGGEVPLHGLRKPPPDRPLVGNQERGDGTLNQHVNTGAAHRFAESEVTIHYRSPIRNLQTPQQQDIDEEELRQRQAEHMRRVYEQERRRKYMVELEDLESRRHMDNFTPLQKSPIPLNRYDDILEEAPHVPHRDQRTPEPKIVARGLYNFVAQNARELSFQAGDIIFVRRQIDKNWYEGEHNAMIGIFPVNYVEIIPYDGVRMTPKKPTESKARVKYNFVAQTPMELSLVKGETVIITRQVDEHWLEGRIGHRRGIFPLSYVEVLPSSVAGDRQNLNKTAVPQSTSALITNGSLRANNYRNQPQYASMPKMSSVNSMPQLQQHQQGYRFANVATPKMNQGNLLVDTHSESILYRALYAYTPQNDDELELQEGDTICVLEKCDDGWYVGTSQRTGLFGTFPGNYVERL